MSYNDTPRSSALSPAPSQPAWSAPRSPIAPHRLAKLANALGVSTPLPAHHFFSASTPNLSAPGSDRSPSAFSDTFRRSPTPSAASTVGTYPHHAPAPSAFLLHVIPPHDLPHDIDETSFPPDVAPPPTASGYHAQFRRGILVPLYPTLQAQLHAIAREYALPSTTGLLLYLASSPRTTGVSSTDELEDDPGPRLSEDIWKVLWARVLKAAERDDSAYLPSRSITPMHGLGLASSPVSLTSQDPTPLRPLISPRPRKAADPLNAAVPSRYPPTPSPSTSSSSEPRRALSGHAPSSSHGSHPDTGGGGGAPSEPDALSDAANVLMLPGLASPSLVPILARVEFAVDRRRAPWLEPWLRSRRHNHAKRAESRAGRRKGSLASESEGGGASEDGRYALLELELLQRQAARAGPAFLRDQVETEEPEDVEDVASVPDEGYAPLSDDLDAGGDVKDEVVDLTAAVQGADPLADVFGTDDDTWTDIHAENRRAPQAVDPNVVPLALDGAALGALPPLHADADANDTPPEDTNEVTEVEALWNRHSRPQLSIAIEASVATEGRKRASSSSTAATVRRHVPPPLVLPPLPRTSLGAHPAPPGSAGSSYLPYVIGGATPTVPDGDDAREDKELRGEHMERETQEGDLHEVVETETDAEMVASTSPEEKRGGTFFEDLDLGLEMTGNDDYDDDDPNDRRKSQYLMAAQLDEIEKALAQFSPRTLNADAEQPMPSISARSASFAHEHSPSLSIDRRISPAALAGSQPQEQWPAVPYSAFSSQSNEVAAPQSNLNGRPSPPRVAINGVTNDVLGINRSPTPAAKGMSDESRVRRREQEEQEALYYPMPPVPHSSLSSDSPLIPLSPDPFGRYPSTGYSSPPPPVPNGLHARDDRHSAFSDATWGRSSPFTTRSPPPGYESGRVSATPSSRFSADSIPDDIVKNGKGANASVKGISKFWRKSNKASISVPPTATAAGQWSGEPVSPSVPMTPKPGQGFDSRSSFDWRQSSASTSPVPTPASPPRTAEKDKARKSILKSWKSSMAGGAAPAPESARTSPEQAQDGGPKRKRRPSMFEAAQSVVRGSAQSSPNPNMESIPPSPRVPEIYRSAPPQPAVNGRAKSALLSSSPQSPSSPHEGRTPSPSRPSYESSFDASEFEMVGP